MAQTEIENLEKILTGINMKLDMLTDDNGEADLVRLYLGELKKILEDEHNGSIAKLEELRSSFGKMISSQEETTGNKFIDIKRQLDILSDDILTHVNSVPEKISFKSLENEISQIEPAINSLKELVLTSSDNKEIIGKFESLENKFKHIVNASDFKEFKTDLADFVQKIIDNSKALHIDIEALTEQVLPILEKLELSDYSKEFENIANRIGEIKLSFENNSKMNYENLINEINNLKTEITSNLNAKDNSAEFVQLDTKLNDLLTNIQFMRDLSSQKYSEILDSISSQLNIAVDKAQDKINSNSEMNFGEIKSLIDNVIVDLNTIKTDLDKPKDDSSSIMTSEIDNLRLSCENILTALNSLSSSFEDNSAKNSENILNGIENISKEISTLNSSFEDTSAKNSQNILNSIGYLSGKTDELKIEFAQTTSTLADKFLDTVNELSAKFEDNSADDNLSQNIEFVKEAVSSMSTDIQVSKEEYLQQLRENSEARSSQINSISENIGSLKAQLTDTIESLKDYISEIEASSGTVDEKISQKLLDMEASLIQSSQEYEQKFEDMQRKLVEFVHIVENSNSDTEGKIVSSLEEISAIRDELGNLGEVIKKSNLSSDEKSSEIISLLDGSIENILFNINGINEAVQKGVELSIKDSLSSVDEGFERLTDCVSNLKDETLTVKDEMLSEVSDKISALKKEFDLINTDIADVLQAKSEDILKAFEPIETRIDEFTGLNFEKLISDLKSQIELSFMNFSVDINSEFASNSEAVSKLEQAYKEAFNKMTAMEDLVTDKINNNIELLKVTLESGLMDVKSSFGSKIEDRFDELYEYIEKGFGDKSVENSIRELKSDINNNFETIKTEQSAAAEKCAEIVNGLSVLSDNISDSLSENLNEISSKLDVVVSDTSSKEFQIRFNNVVEAQNKAENLINILNSKVDALASDSTNLVVLDELDDVKNIISEQKDFIESLSNEKFSAFDNCLKEALDKINNLDLSKSSEDIKETLLSAIVSLTDQISFVEESEELKDFVEEKTDKINEQITEVQNQLKQLASNDDDSFEYTYTLRDVETDIAKLRIAINEMSGANFDDINNEIQKLVKSLENLDASLTQEQIETVKNDIEKLNEDIISISSRTNKLLLNSDESYKALNEGLNKFAKIIDKFDSTRLERKIDNIQSLAANSANADKVFHQAMMYLGEWIDATSEDIKEIDEKVSAISSIQNDLSEVKKSITESETVFDEIKHMIPDNSQVIDALKQEFNYQEKRIDALENKLDKILSILTEKDDTVLSRKVDKLEKMLSNLGANIEKLTSYVE